MGQCWDKFCKGGQDDGENPSTHLAGGNVLLVTEFQTWESKLLEAKENGKPVVANFSAPWCNPCKSMVSIYREIADKYPSIVFLTVDVDDLPDLSTSWDVKATPTFYMIRNGKAVDKLVGANKEDLLQKIATLVAGSSSRHK